jgi:hypothetical protein
MALLQCDPKHFVIGPHKRMYAETMPYVDQARKIKEWRKLCKGLAGYARMQGQTAAGAKLAGVFMAVIQLMVEFTGTAEGLPKAWPSMYVGDDFMRALEAQVDSGTFPRAVEAQP